MRTRFFLSTVAAIAISIVASISASAQDWSTVKRFMNTEKAGQTLASIAHPTADYLSSSVISSDSNTITVKVSYEGFLLSDYYCKYELEKASLGGGNIISRVRCTSEGALISSFTAWSSISDYTFFSYMYDKFYNENPSEVRSVWGGSKFSEISNSAKAGFVMTITYAEYIN